MFKIINQLNEFNIEINLIKVPSHIGIHGNRMADILAKQAATIAFNCKYKMDNIIDFSTYFNPINVDISKDLIWLNKFYKKKREDMWIKRQSNWKKGKLKSNQYIGNTLMQQFMVSYDGNNYRVRNLNKKFRNQLKHLKQYESEIIQN